MKKIFICFSIVIALLLAPIAHAFDLGCQGDSSHISKKVEKHSKNENQQSNAKIADCCDHCSHSHSAVIINSGLSSPERSYSQAMFLAQDLFLSSVVQGPPLKPPSHS